MRHVLDRIAVHYAWDRGLPAALRIASGDEVSFSVGAPASAPAPQRHKYEGEKTTGPMPLSGPVWVEGAKPSDVLEIHIGEVRPDNHGYTAISAGFGLLGDEFLEC